MVYPIIIILLVAYFLGGINGSVSISTLLQHEDVRSHGSGNAGLTNFFRSYGGKAAFLVILVDGGKAVLATLMGGLILAPYGQRELGMVLGGAAVSFGHDFPVLLGFRGGKGILSGVFVLIAFDWRIAAAVFSLFLILYCITKYVSLGSVAAAAAVVVCFVVFYRDNVPVMLLGSSIGLLALYMHRGNIVRLLKGEERKTYFWGKKK